MFVRTKRRGQRTYLMVVKNERIAGKVKQRVLYSLGRLDLLQASGELDALLLSAQRFSKRLAVLGAEASGAVTTSRSRRIGAVLVFERLWQELQLEAIIKGLVKERQFGFAVERAVFLTVLHRLLVSGSDRAAERWKEEYAIAGVEELGLHHLYRTMSWLGEPLPGGELACRCLKDQIEEELFARRRDLFANLDLVFFDTTSLYFEGEGGESLGRHGHSKDHRPDLKQMVVGVALDGAGRPLCSELWPGNSSDVKSLLPVTERLEKRFAVGEVCLVADRGMVSKGTVAELERRGLNYILGMRRRSTREVREEVLGRGGRYREVCWQRLPGKAALRLKVKEVVLKGKRYIVCLNEEQAAKDRDDRQAIVSSLAEALRRGEKELIGNSGYRRYLRLVGKRLMIDEEKVEAEARYDGKWVLATNTTLPASEVALKYKQLWMVESIFRSLKSLLQTRPIYHKSDAAIRGHVFCSFLALLLRKELQDRLAAKGWRLEWAEIIRDLDNLVEIEVTINDHNYLLRSSSAGTVSKVFQACGLALPPLVRQR